MSSDIRIKMCGLRTVDDIVAAADAGAAYIGFVFFEKSPRNVTIQEAAMLAVEVPMGIVKVALVVNPTDAFLDNMLASVPIDMVQLHGAETPERVAEVRARTGLPVMKAIGVAGPEDLFKIDDYSAVADQLLIDAKPASGGDLPGGNGLTFDWRLLADRKYWTKPWMLAGGLTPDNVADAVRLTGATQVDLSSALERAPGVKDAGKIAAFGRAVAVA